MSARRKQSVGVCRSFCSTVLIEMTISRRPRATLSKIGIKPGCSCICRRPFKQRSPDTETVCTSHCQICKASSSCHSRCPIRFNSNPQQRTIRHAHCPSSSSFPKPHAIHICKSFKFHTIATSHILTLKLSHYYKHLHIMLN